MTNHPLNVCKLFNCPKISTRLKPPQNNLLPLT